VVLKNPIVHHHKNVPPQNYSIHYINCSR